MKKLLILVGSIVLTGSIVAFGLLAHKNREIDLQKINSAVESFSQLDNGEMRSCTQSSSALKDLQYSYEDNVQLLFSQADGAFNYDLWQTSIQGNQTYQIGYKQLDGTFYRTDDQEHWVVYEPTRKQLPTVLAQMLQKVDPDLVETLSSKRTEQGTRYHVVYQIDPEQSTGVDGYRDVKREVDYLVNDQGVLIGLEIYRVYRVGTGQNKDTVTQTMSLELLRYNQHDIAAAIG